MGKNPSEANKKEAPKFRINTVISYYKKENGHYGMRITEVKEEIVKK
jgi:hypothetical protein